MSAWDFPPKNSFEKAKRIVYPRFLTKKDLGCYEISVDLRKVRRYDGETNTAGRAGNACRLEMW